MVAVDPLLKSASSPNQYFDVQMQVNETDQKGVRVMMLDTKAPPSFFKQHQQSIQSIKLKSVSYAPSRTIFMNKASSVEVVFPHECQFKYAGQRSLKFHKVDEIMKFEGVFNIKGKLSFQGTVRTPEKCKKSVEDGMFTDQSGSIPISVWEDHFSTITENSLVVHLY